MVVLEPEQSVEDHGGDHDGDADTRRSHGDQPPLGRLHRHRPLLPRCPRGEQPLGVIYIYTNICQSKYEILLKLVYWTILNISVSDFNFTLVEL